MKRNKSFVFFIATMLCVSLFAQTVFAKDTGYKRIANITMEEDGDIQIQLMNVTENNGWYKIYKSEAPTDLMAAVLLTAFSTGRDIKLFLNSSNHGYKVRVH